MKISLMIAVCLALTGCGIQEEYAHIKKQTQIKTESLQHANIKTIGTGTLGTYEYDGHTYVIYNAGGLVHHPECSCKEKE